MGWSLTSHRKVEQLHWLEFPPSNSETLWKWVIVGMGKIESWVEFNHGSIHLPIKLEASKNAHSCSLVLALWPTGNCPEWTFAWKQQSSLQQTHHDNEKGRTLRLTPHGDIPHFWCLCNFTKSSLFLMVGKCIETRSHICIPKEADFSPYSSGPQNSQESWPSWMMPFPLSLLDTGQRAELAWCITSAKAAESVCSSCVCLQSWGFTRAPKCANCPDEFPAIWSGRMG